ncbi:MAG: ribbon-helix-helix protein, CopG family [Cyanobacteria bacterium P01_G01_bin.54]
MAAQIPLTCKIPEAWLAAIDHYAEAQQLSRSEVLKVAIAHLLELEEPAAWSAQLARLEQQMTKLSKQVTVLHKRLRTVEERPATPLPTAQLPTLPTPAAIAPASAPQTLVATPSLVPPPAPVSLAAGTPSPAIADAMTPSIEAIAASLNGLEIDAIEGELLHQDPPPSSRAEPQATESPVSQSQPEAATAPPAQPRVAARLQTAAPMSAQMSAQMSALTRSSPKAPLGSLKLEELCRVNRIDPLAIQRKADAVGLSLAEAIEIETGWKYEPKTKTYTPPI